MKDCLPTELVKKNIFFVMLEVFIAALFLFCALMHILLRGWWSAGPRFADITAAMSPHDC